MNRIEQAIAIISNSANINICEVSDDANVENLAAWDSIAHVNIMIAIEEAIGRTLQPMEIVRMMSVREVAAILAKTEHADD